MFFQHPSCVHNVLTFSRAKVNEEVWGCKKNTTSCLRSKNLILNFCFVVVLIMKHLEKVMTGVNNV